MYDGGLSTSPMMGKYCGDSIPPSLVSSSNEILIHFHSDYSETEAGFQMEYHPRGKQNTPIQNNTEYHRDRYRILGTLFIVALLFCMILIKFPNLPVDTYMVSISHNIFFKFLEHPEKIII